MSEIELSLEQADYILSPQAVRERAEKILELTEAGEGHFHIHKENLDFVANYVADVIKEKYPSLEIPYHSRWSHFQVGGVDRLAKLTEKMSGLESLEKCRTLFDLVVTSVLLDAGAGPHWKFQEETSLFSRSEGLAVASFYMFMNGVFSSTKGDPLRADATGLLNITEEKIEKSFQVSVGNPLLGVGGRVSLLQRLGQALNDSEVHFNSHEPARVGDLVDYLSGLVNHGQLDGADLLQSVLKGMGSIWPGRLSAQGYNLGDTWEHPRLGAGFAGLVPLHKLSQWLTYSLLEPLESIDWEITNLHALTGLAEYRNGGLMVDGGLLSIKDERLREQAHHPSSPLIIEWRALTVCLLDQVAARVREIFGKTESEFPLVKVLEGGTWWAGRKMAAKNRSDQSPPIKIISDGTVF